MKKWSALLISLIAFNANAQDTATITWTNATQNTDTSPLTDLVETRIYYGVCDNGDLPVSPIVEVRPTTIPGNSETWTTPELAALDWCFAGTHVNAQGEESDFSATVLKTIPDTVVPQPPLNLTVDPTSLVAYYISITTDVIVLFPVGSVSEGVACDTSMEVNQHYLIPRNEVQWASGFEPPVVFAKCS